MCGCVVVGLGNVLLQDEGVGVHVVRELEKRMTSPDVEFVDGATGGFELISHCCNRDKVIIVDAMLADGLPGDVYRVPLEGLDLNYPTAWSAHQSGLQELVKALNTLKPKPVVIVFGIVPASVNTPGMELSDPVRLKLPEIVAIIRCGVETIVGPSSHTPFTNLH